MDEIRIERQSSIENEPLTLNFHQIDFAREMALDLVKTRSIEEALSIFTEGHEEACTECDISTRTGEQDENYWNCDDRIRINTGLKDIVSAPF